MSTEKREIVELVEQLPEGKRLAVADFARFLLAQQDDERWERIVAEPTPRPKFEAFLKASRAEGSQPLDPERL